MIFHEILFSKANYPDVCQFFFIISSGFTGQVLTYAGQRHVLAVESHVLANLVSLVPSVFLVGAFLGKSARLLQWLVFFLFFFRQTTISL